MIRDRMSGALIQAWPQLEREMLEVRCAKAPCDAPKQALVLCAKAFRSLKRHSGRNSGFPDVVVDVPRDHLDDRAHVEEVKPSLTRNKLSSVASCSIGS